MKKIILMAMVAFAFTSCEDYLDVNGDQSNNPGADVLTPSSTLAAALNQFANNQVTNLNLYGNRMSYAWGLNFGFTTTEPAYDYIYSSSSYSGIWDNTYLIADNFQDILDNQAKFPDYSYHFAIAKAFKVMSMDYIVTLYGDAPYSQAFNHEQFPYPQYDDDKAVYPQLFTLLDEAKELINNPSANVVDLGSEDIYMGGDTSRWLQFINTLELKMLLRLSKTTDPALVTLRNTRFAALDAAQNFITADVTCNPGYNESVLAQYTPLYRVYGINEAHSAYQPANRANAAGLYIASVVNGTRNDANITTGITDPRRGRMFTAVGGTIVGNEQGLFPTVAISRLGSFVSGIYSTAGPDLDAAARRDAYVMLAAESYFLQAEAFQRGYLTGNAQTAFNNGITASFNFYSTGWGTYAPTTLNAGAYITAIDAKNGLGWAGSTDKISAIMTQKYLALAQFHGIETYFDHMRTGYPVLPLPTGVSQTTRPTRLIYATSEYSSNSQNVPAVSNADLFGVNTKTPYYLQ